MNTIEALRAKAKKADSGEANTGSPSEVEYEKDSEGRWQKFQVFGIRLIWPGEGTAMRVRTVLYSTICSDIEFEQGNDGVSAIRFFYMNEMGMFKVVIGGKELESMFNHLSEGRRLSVRLTGNVKKIDHKKVEEDS